MGSSIKFSCILSAALALIACGDGGDDGDTGGTTGGGAGCTTDTYANYAQQLFTANCTTCHGALAAMLGDNVRLDTLALVKEWKPHIIEHAVKLQDPIMPSGTQGLMPAERERLQKWLDCGPN
jgi:mono/diheme cytochrome c family protein